MPFKTNKQRKYLFAKKPDVAKKLAHKYAYGGTIGGGESVAGTSSNGTQNRHVFKDGGVVDKDKKKKDHEEKEESFFKKLKDMFDIKKAKSGRGHAKGFGKIISGGYKEGGIIKNPCGYHKIHKMLKKKK